ncbi:N-6 DNA methylase [Lactiplantibacillus paraplantarum]|uniref:N-6 DNA methylase n=1 Tax=Lactiplantibacillus paraplantarum TaxID=60520 RepID=UPI000E094470|nr:N-6 DNA methylase [Lactiplantibacillus paraplantarum]MCW1908913.1 N-6 DNA methylase [Lactiplantibacillus paraplantarum]RDG11886.1 DNA methyltransferase [Lactiplantibacillus paraplantarum]
MTEKLIKSVERVKNHGEVFTPKRIVNLMLNQPEITAKIDNLSATFLEPSAGEGAFLVEILKQKIRIANDQSCNIKEFDTNALIALSTLYGIEYLEDNVEMLVMNMITTFIEEYTKIVIQQYKGQVNKKVAKSAKVIINANMAQGDTLKRVSLDGKPIIFSEWKTVSGRKWNVQRTEYTFDAIVNGDAPNDNVQGYLKGKSEQLDLFSIDDDQIVDDENVTQYLPVKWVDIYQQRVG